MKTGIGETIKLIYMILFVGLLLILVLFIFFFFVPLSVIHDIELADACKSVDLLYMGRQASILTCLNKETGTTREFYYDCDWGFYKVDCEYIELNQDEVEDE